VERAHSAVIDSLKEPEPENVAVRVPAPNGSASARLKSLNPAGTPSCLNTVPAIEHPRGVLRIQSYENSTFQLPETVNVSVTPELAVELEARSTSVDGESVGAEGAVTGGATGT